MRMFGLVAAGALLSLQCISSASAQTGTSASSYPSKAVTLVVPFAAGGSTDILARAVGQRLEREWGKPFIVENRAGAGGIVGAQAVARAPADGHTLLLGAANLAINATLYKQLPYDTIKDFIPIVKFGESPFVVTVNASLPIHSLSDLFDYGRKNTSGGLNYGTAGIGTLHHLFGEMLSSQSGVRMTMVPYRGGAPALADVVGGHIPFMVADFGAIEGALDGKLVRAIGVTLAAQKIPQLRDVPSVSTALPGFPEGGGWYIIAAPRDTPQAIVEKLHTQLKRTLDDPTIEKVILGAGVLPQPSPSTSELQQFLEAEIARWRKTIQEVGLEGKF